MNWTEHGIESGLLPLGVAAAPPNVMVAGVFADNISPDNGKTWGKTTGAHVQSQCLKAANGLFFAVGGQDFGTGQGVVVSTDNGKTFEAKYADCAFTEARYGAFPTKDTWYVTLGSWPETDDESNAVTPARRLAPAGAPRGGWNAQIIGTTDGGNTWTSQYGTNNTEQFVRACPCSVVVVCVFLFLFFVCVLFHTRSPVLCLRSFRSSVLQRSRVRVGHRVLRRWRV